MFIPVVVNSFITDRYNEIVVCKCIMAVGIVSVSHRVLEFQLFVKDKLIKHTKKFPAQI